MISKKRGSKRDNKPDNVLQKSRAAIICQSHQMNCAKKCEEENSDILTYYHNVMEYLGFPYFNSQLSKTNQYIRTSEPINRSLEKTSTRETMD